MLILEYMKNVPIFSFCILLFFMFGMKQYLSLPKNNFNILDQRSNTPGIFSPFVIAKNELESITSLEIINHINKKNMLINKSNFKYKDVFQQYVENLGILKIKRTLPYNKNNLKNYSLSIPLLSIQGHVDLLNKKITKITFGVYNPIDHSIYALLEGNKKEIFQLETGSNFNLLDLDQQISL